MAHALLSESFGGETRRTRRKYGGRKKGTPNKRTQALHAQAAQAQASGLMPLDYMLSIMREKNGR